jgi:hypothetical protein
MPTFTAALEMLTLTDIIIPSTPAHQVLRKRTSLSDLVSPSKKGPSVSIVSVEPPDITPLTSNTHVFTTGYSEKSPTRAIFKAARKGKNKLVPMVLDSETVCVKGGLCKASLAAMRILSYNCKGLSRPAVVQTMMRLIQDQSPNILFLSETKISPPQVSTALNRLGFFLMSQVAAFGSSGGLVLSWRPGVDLECFTSNKNNITVWCYYDPPQSP